MNRRKLFSMLIALSLILITIPITVNAPLDEWVTSEVDEDLFWGPNRFDGVDMVYLQGDEIQIFGWYLFEGPDVLEWGKPISEAYLSIRIMGDNQADPDASMTLYGQPARKGGAQSLYDEPDQINGPYTANHVNVNLSSFVGAGTWYNITVTNIIREINQGYYFYDGHSVAFITLSPDGHDAERYVSSEESGYAAKLYVHYKTPDTPPGLPPDVEFVEDYRNYTIWTYNESTSFDIGYTFSHVNGGEYFAYYDDIDGSGPYLIGSTGAINGIQGNGRKLVKTRDGKLFAVYQAKPGAKVQVYVKESVDDGLTWTNEVKLNSIAGMDVIDCNLPTIAIDGSDNLHVVFYGLAPFEEIWYTNYTGSWSTPLEISTLPCVGEQSYPAIAIDSNGVLHVTWECYTTPQIFYTNYTDSWSTPLDISTMVEMDARTQYYPSIAIDSDNHVHITWFGKTDDYPVNAQSWYRERTTEWQNISRVSIGASMENYYQNGPVVAIDPDDFPHVVWSGKPGTQNQIWHNSHNGTIWLTPLDISTDAINNGRTNSAPVIGIDGTATRYVLWHDNYGEIWLTIYTVGWSAPTIEQTEPTADQTSNLLFPLELLGDTVFVITDENGTVVDTWTEEGENFTDIDDLKDWIDEEIYGYPDPEDPDPSGWEDAEFLTIHRFKLVLFIIGMIMFVGTPVYGFASRPEAATWITIFMCMIVGIALLWSLQTM